MKLIKKSAIENKADLVRIRREIRIMSALNHPNIIQIFEGTVGLGPKHQGGRSSETLEKIFVMNPQASSYWNVCIAWRET